MTKFSNDRYAAYRAAGVDLDASNIASQIAGDRSRETWDNAGGKWHPESPDKHLAASKVMPLDEIRLHIDTDGVSGADGTGTKPELYERLRNFRGLGHDLIAMAVDDLPVEGGQAVWVNNILSVSKLDETTLPYIEELFDGLRDAAKLANVVVWTGEIATHGSRLSGPTDFTVDWAADSFGLVHKSRVITGEKVKVGDVLYGFAEPNGFRCNGISLVRKIMQQAFGDDWHTKSWQSELDASFIPNLGEAVAQPSTIYAGLMNELLGGYNVDQKPAADIHGVAHISGGSLPEKLGRMLRTNNLGAFIPDPFELPQIMRECQYVCEIPTNGVLMGLSDEELYTTWHGGQGYVVAAPEDDHDTLIATGRKHNITVKPIGYVTGKPGLRLTSKALHSYGEMFVFPPS